MKSNPLLTAFFPARCCGCDQITGNNMPVCADCKKLVLHPSEPASACEVCGQQIKNCVCKKHQYYSKLIPCFYYEGPPVKTIFKLKFRSRPDIAENYSKLLLNCLEERELLKNIDIITSVPMRKFKKFKRGYNQSELLAKHLSEYTNIPYEQLLEKKFASSSQHQLNALSRTGNLLGCFEPKKERISTFSAKTVLVVDDVLTTGSTLNEISKTLLVFGAASVYTASCAVTKKKNYIERK